MEEENEIIESHINRFDLEQAIIACGNIADDLDMLVEAVIEDTLTRDQVANVLLGLKELHELRCKRVFDIFSVMIRDGLIL